MHSLNLLWDTSGDSTRMAFCLQWQYLGDEERNNTCDNQNGNKSSYCCFYITTNVIRGDGSRK